MPEVRARRVYEEPQASDGTRVLVDRLWPRGLAKDAAHIDEWLKAVAPSDELRRWYGHDPAKFAEFRSRYGDELLEQERAGALRHLRELAAAGTVTLLTATKDLEHSQAADLAERLREAPAASPGPARAGYEEERGGDPACWLHRVCPRCGTMAETDPPTTCPRCRTDIPAA
ncbi:MAG TPA: DUF488 family protein [Streptosporangiaceae bacterium]